MARTSLLLVVAASLVAVWIGRVSSAVPGFVMALAVGIVAALALDAVQRSRLRALARGVSAWMGKVDIEPVHVRGGHDAQQFASALNALGAAYGRRGQRVLAADPQLRDLVEALPEPAMLFDTELVLVAANEEAAELFTVGTDAAEAPTATQALGSAALADLVRLTVTNRQQHRLETRVGDRIIEAATTPLAGKVLLLATDRTQDVRLEALRRDFVANASHELKSPVAGIQSLADALDIVVERDTDKAQELVGRIRGEADRLSALVADLLSLRRVDERITGDAVDTVDLIPVAQQVMAQLEADARARDLTLELVADDGAVAVRTVPEDLQLILANLVDNAIKYNRPGGRVKVVVRHVGAEVVIEVKDTGIGIPGKDLGRIFERFQRVDEGRSRAAGGTGLGLSIVRHAVERNGGHVGVTSLLGSGTTFTVTFPAVGP